MTDDLKNTDYVIASCDYDGDVAGHVEVLISTDKAFNAAGAKVQSVNFAIGIKGTTKVQTLKAQVTSSLRGTENGETPGDTNDYGTSYWMTLAPGAKMAGGFDVSKVVVKSKDFMDIFQPRNSLVRRQEIGTCGLKNVKVLEKVMPLAG